MITPAAVLARRAKGDSGFALTFAMMVTTVVMLTLTTVMVSVQPGIAGAKRTQDQAAAFLAARSGIDDALAYLMSIPACRSASRICTAATQMTGDSSKPVTSDNLAAAGSPRPVLTRTTNQQFQQQFSWAINPNPTPEGYLRVTSTGKYLQSTRTVVADLALNPSLLAYGYYTDYESLSPSFLSSYYKPRSIYLDDASTCSGISSVSSCSSASPKYANWANLNYTAGCGQHWYVDGTTAGRYNATAPTETGKVGTTASTTPTSGTAVSRNLSCDLVFSSSMVQNGMTYTRDAIATTGTGPKFNQPVYTLWGYKYTNVADPTKSKDYTTPAFPSSTQKYNIVNNGSTLSNSPYVPAVAKNDLALPSTIGANGIPTNACVYYGPTRVKLNGDGTATITSPSTKSANAASDKGCYPTTDFSANGLVRTTVNYAKYGGGAIVVHNLGSAPSTGWPVNQTLSTQTPSAANEVFYLPADGSGEVANDADKSVADDSGCTAGAYSNAVAASCAWTNLYSATNVSPDTGWTSYGTKTCASTTDAADRRKYECEAGSTSTTADVKGGKYATLRSGVQAELAKANCINSTPDTCLAAIVQAKLPAATSTVRYVATGATGTPVTSKVTAPSSKDPLLTAAGNETLVRTPVTVSVSRQTKSGSTWSTGTAQFATTVTNYDYSWRSGNGASVFPNPLDVTAYNTGVDAAGKTAGAAGTRQPGDVYVDGANKGKLSVLADNDVVLTGDITNPSGYTPDTDAVSITAGQDVRNYHPVSCTDQDEFDINATTPGWCPNDFTGLSSANGVTADRYANMQTPASRNIYAVLFALSGSLGTDNYNRADPVGNLNVFGGVYQSHRGGNGVVSGNTTIAGTNLQYTYVDLQRANLPYVPSATVDGDARVWNIVSISPG